MTSKLPRLPIGQRIYAVGDIHGRDDLLDQLLTLICADAADVQSETACTIVCLGDYVDRGPGSRAVIERLSQGPPPGFGLICLRGNHDHTMLRFLDDASIGGEWMFQGGGATLASYGLHYAHGSSMAELRRRFSDAVPHRHKVFLSDLRPFLTVGGYLFVHAGIRPGIALAQQSSEDLMWIRSPFLESKLDHGFVVVHGHTIVKSVEVRHNRIAIDTGAFLTGRLTCLVLSSQDHRIIST